MERKIYAVIVAGGSGTRMGGPTPKQFLPLGGRPILQRTIENFSLAFPDAEILVVLPEEHFGTWMSLCEKYNFVCRQHLIKGGITRFHSVKNALEKVPDGAVVMVHDAVRPLAGPEFLTRLAEGMMTSRALIPVVPVQDTLKRLSKAPDGSLSTAPGDAPDRSELFAAQTPQCFRSEDLKQAYLSLGYRTEFTDDASVASEAGIPLSWAAGEKYNLKITTPEDLVVAEALISF